MIRPRNPRIGGDREHLVRIPARAGVDLHLDTVDCRAGGDVEAFVPKGDYGGAGGGP